MVFPFISSPSSVECSSEVLDLKPVITVNESVSHMCVSISQWCETLWDPMNCIPAVSSVHGISQVRIPDRVAISYFTASSPPMDQVGVSCISCTGRQILYHCDTWEAFSHVLYYYSLNFSGNFKCMQKWKE